MALDQLGRRLSFDEEGTIVGDESDVDPLSLGGLGVVKPQTRMPAGDYTELLRKRLASPVSDRPFDSKPFDSETIALLREQEQGRLEEAMKRGHSQKPPVVLENVGIAPGKTRTRGALSLTGGATQFPITPEGEPTRTEVLTRRADPQAGMTVMAPAGEGKPEASAKVSVPGAGGDEGLDNLALGELITRGIGAVYQGATGRQVGGNIPEMLAAVRQRREAQAQRERELGAEQAREEARASRAEQLESVKAARLAETERQTNAAYAETLKRLYPEEAAAGVFDGLEEAAGKPQFAAIARALESRLKGAVERPRIQAQTTEIPLEGASKRAARESRTAVDKARINKIYSDMQLAGAKLALDERKLLQAADKTQNPAEKLEKLNTIADQKDFGGFRTMISDLQAVEAAAPGFVTQGKVPSWLTSEQMYLAQTVPAMADPKVVKFVSAFSILKNEDRHRLYGSAQTEGELRSYLQQLNDSPFSAGPQVLAQQVGTLTKKASEKATGRIKRYNQVFGTDNVNNVLGGEWQGFYGKGGVLSQEKTPFGGTQVAPTGAGPSTAKVRIRRKSDGVVRSLSREQADVLLKDTGFEEVR